MMKRKRDKLAAGGRHKEDEERPYGGNKRLRSLGRKSSLIRPGNDKGQRSTCAAEIVRNARSSGSHVLGAAKRFAARQNAQKTNPNCIFSAGEAKLLKDRWRTKQQSFSIAGANKPQIDVSAVLAPVVLDGWIAAPGCMVGFSGGVLGQPFVES